MSNNKHDEEKNKHTRTPGIFHTPLPCGGTGDGHPSLDILVLDVWGCI